jgi:hypothetical protein
MLVVAIVLWVRATPRTAITFPTFSVTISRVAHNFAYVTYRGHESSKYLDFEAGIARGKKFFIPRILLKIPAETPSDVVREIVPNLVMGLEGLRYEYLIYRLGEPQSMPENERTAAMPKLREVGIEICEVTADRIRLNKTPLSYWQRIAGLSSKTTTDQWLSLLSTARGVRHGTEVLAQSGSLRERIRS